MSYAALVATVAVHAASIHLLASSSSIRAGSEAATGGHKVTVVSGVTKESNPSDRVEARIVYASTSARRSVDKLGNAPPTKASQEAQGIVVAQPAGPYYFRLSELTHKPVVKHDAVTGLVLHHPGLPPQPVVLRLFISDEGIVDRVLVEDSYLRDDIERQVNEALSQVMFEPGRIGRIAVRSQMRVEARLEPIVSPLPAAAATAY